MMKPLQALRLALLMPALIVGAMIVPGACAPGAPREIPDTLKVVTVYGPSTYFLYRDTIEGVDYDLVEELAAEHGFEVDWQIAPDMERAVAWLDSGRVDLLAAGVKVNGRFKKKIAPCGPETMTQHVVIQPAGDTVMVTVEQLVGHDVFVEKDSRSEQALRELNHKLREGIRIHAIDTLAGEDLVAMVSADSIPLAVVDSETARLNAADYPNVDYTLALGSPELTRWAVAKRNRWLGDSIDRWMNEPLTRRADAEILARYFETARNTPSGPFDLEFNNGHASPFDHLYRRHATPGGWDWRLIAAQGFTESRFDSTARSWAGATGVMQIMPKTAKDFGLSRKDMTKAEPSISTAVKILNAYDKILAKKVSDPEERKKFVMAAYNAGPGHVLDAINLAKKYGMNPQKWDGNVEKAMLMKMKRKYYRDPVVKYGYARGRETVNYVKRIWDYYARVSQKVSL